jgi:hypothetical protein
VFSFFDANEVSIMMLMKKLPMLLIGAALWITAVNMQFHQYHTHYLNDHGDHTCFYRYANEMDGRVHSLISYCIRSSIITSPGICYGKTIAFEELKGNHITARQLLLWFAPIDLISNYEDFLINGSGSNQELLCNCSQHSFGARCQYQFATVASSFDALVDGTLASKNQQRDIRTLTEEDDVTCYTLFNCTPATGFCLDWRQICDSRIDCINGEDEQRCIEKELNECDERVSYRCSSGHCIPRAFAFDLTLDCPD